MCVQMRLIWLRLLALAIGLSATAAAQRWYSTGGGWSNRKAIRIDHTKVSGSSSLTNFPVLVLLTSDPNLQSTAKSDGSDIVFTDGTGVTKLAHEIESYSAGTLVAWVQVPTVSTTSNTVIYM